MGKTTRTAIIGLAAVALLGASGAGAAPANHAAPQCFNLRDWSGWKASADGKSIYIRTGVRNLYRLDFDYACHAAQGIGVHLVTKVRGGSFICNPLDLDLKVADGTGFATPCIVSKITPLSADEAAALPKALTP
jgi:Family of unknown function (DUF6491)